VQNPYSRAAATEQRLQAQITNMKKFLAAFKQINFLMMQYTKMKFCEFNSNRIQTQDHYFLPNWCGIPMLEMERCPSFKLILVALTLAAQTVCISVLANLCRLQA